MKRPDLGFDNEGEFDTSKASRNSIPHALLMITAVGVAWFPVESRPWSAPVFAAVVLALIPWGWRHSSRPTRLSLLFAGSAVALLSLSGMTGWDPSRAVGTIGIVAAVVAVAWLASRTRPPEQLVLLVAIGLAALSIWGLAQVAFGLEGLRGGFESLSAPALVYAEERLASSRAFASLPLPSHLAVMLAMALPLLLRRIRATPSGAMWAAWSVLAIAGLVATRSPAGVGIAVLTSSAVLLRKRRDAAIAGALALVTALVAVILIRPDMARLEPVGLRLDNWRTAVWLWSTSPASGVGVASFAQASQAVPFEVGNRPAHAHGLPFELLAELGPAGLAAVSLLGIALIRLSRRRWAARPALTAAVLVVPLHNLVDFSFFVSGVAISWAVLLGWLVADRSDDAPVATRSVSVGRTAAVLAAAIGLAVTVLHGTSIVVEDAAAQAPSSAERIDGAFRALKLAPWRVEPQFLVAAAALDHPEPMQVQRARSALERLTWLRPRSAALAERRAQLALLEGDVSSALAELWSAATYGSRDSGASQALAELVEQVERVDRVPPG